MRASLALLVLLAAAASATMERVCLASCNHDHSSVPAHWRHDVERPAAASETVLLSFALRNDQGAAALKAAVREISDPFSPRFRQFLTLDEAAAVLRASPAASAAVIRALKSAGIESAYVSATGDWVQARARVDAVAALFGEQCRPQAFVANERPIRILRSRCALTLPAALARFVDYVHGLTAFPIPSAVVASPSASAPHVTPQLLFAMYNISEPAAAGTNASQACAEFERETWSQPDLTEFEKKFRLETAAVKTVGDHGLGKTEANLDVQYITAMASGVPTTMWLAAGYSFNLVAWAQDVLATHPIPLVWSISYGEDLTTVDPAYAQQLDECFQTMAAMGISVLFASGDSGVWSRGASTSGAFQPTFPASLPHVTAVGATQMNSAGVEDSSTSWSGGGFSLAGYFDRETDAPWQVDAVAGYLNSTSVKLPPSNLYNGATGVAFPDVAALGVDFEVIMGLIPEPVSGTSCAAPTFAGVIAWINSHLLAAGKPPLGFLNPWLYKVAHPSSCLHDIVQGDNSNGNANGFEATVGFDPVTGLGTPNAFCLRESAFAVSPQ